MPGWNTRQMPHPLLAPWTDDYDEDSEFGATVPAAVLTASGTINIHIQYHLASPTLADLIDQGKATYTVLIACAHTFTRETFATGYPEQHLALPASNYADTLLITPHVCAEKQIADFISPEHSLEYKQIRPQGFVIAPATILAIGETTGVQLQSNGNPYSVIDLVGDEHTATGKFTVSLDEDRIKIHLSPKDRIAIDSYRNKGAYSPEFVSMFSGIYLHAVTEAIRNLPERPTKTWQRTIQGSLQKHGIDDDDGLMRNDALAHAQTIMGNPIGHLLTVFSKREDED